MAWALPAAVWGYDEAGGAGPALTASISHVYDATIASAAGPIAAVCDSHGCKASTWE